MIFFWRKELDNYRSEVAKSKDKHIQALMKPLTLLEKKPPIYLFKHILFRCKILHSLAFYQWRYFNSPRGDKFAIIKMFESIL